MKVKIRMKIRTRSKLKILHRLYRYFKWMKVSKIKGLYLNKFANIYEGIFIENTVMKNNVSSYKIACEEVHFVNN